MNASLSHKITAAAVKAGISIGTDHVASLCPSRTQLLKFATEMGVLPADDGLFDGLLDELMVLNRHRQRQVEMAANGEYEDRVRLIHEFMRTDASINEKSGEFIRKFGDRLTLKEIA